MSLISGKYVAVLTLLLTLYFFYRTSKWKMAKDKVANDWKKPLPLYEEEIKPFLASSPAHLRDLFHERLEVLRRACQDNGAEVPMEVIRPNFLFNVAPEQRLVMCKTAKHGTTTWSSYFLQIITNGWHGLLSSDRGDIFLILEIHRKVRSSTALRNKLKRRL